ncbi:uncharacterized protein LOC119070072 isoform X1 [Bradysia coprophila]|uniref:uncharacterized protein LOC119070072 isoform X1 n=1 Tax=Bradysia coprophila TaxID=38358 RepID=UPI00187DBD7E|nr:uncharacterized protein LOC119070072 isoform X1 [Bradysia coprophila]
MQRSGIVYELTCDIRKFSVYRTANKLALLKKSLKTEHIPYKLVLSVLDVYKLNSPVIDRQEINEEKLENVIHDAFFAAEKQGNFTSGCIESTARTLTEYLLQIFNPNNSVHCTIDRSIRLYDLKQALLILCKDAGQEDLIYEHFLLNCDHNRCVTRYRLKEMLSKVAHILLHVDREFDMDWHPSNVIDEWFSKCPGIVGLNEYQFTSFWVESKSIFRNYAQLMAISQLISDTKDTVHPVDCSLCKTDIKGLRLQCTVCTGYSLCFECFCTDANTENHTISHRLGDAYILNKCRLFLKKCWNVFGCRDGTSSGRIQSIGMTTIKTNFSEFRQEFTTITNQNVSRQSQGSFASRRNSNQIECKLSSIIGLILSENEKLSAHVADLDTNGNGNNAKTKKLIENHLVALKTIVNQLEEYSMRSTVSPTSSTPYRNPSIIRKSNSQTDVFLSKSLKGAEINKSFLEQNNSNLSISDVSSWLHTKRSSSLIKDKKENLPTVSEDQCETGSVIDTDMQNFRELLHIVKDIIEDTYSDNTELSKATNQLENVLDSIIEVEERKRNKP